TMCADAYSAAEGADAVVLVTEWETFKSVNFRRLHAIMRRPMLMDGRNMYDGREMREIGFTYAGVGVAGEAAREDITQLLGAAHAGDPCDAIAQLAAD
ncbi:MAG: UDP binding domain-containing protein, partial [Gemmatimonadaceae bacterium]